MRYLLTISLVLLFCAQTPAQINPSQSFSPANMGMTRIITQDSINVGGGKSDTSTARGITFDVYGHDEIGLFVRYTGRNDSINSIVYGDFSPDGKNWLYTVALDSTTVSGAGNDTTVARADSIPSWAYQGRIRVFNRAASTDTTTHDIWLLIHHLRTGKQVLR